jgi:hypothetical protein
MPERKFEMTQDRAEKLIFEYEAVFEPNDYLYFYEDMLTE